MGLCLSISQSKSIVKHYSSEEKQARNSKIFNLESNQIKIVSLITSNGQDYEAALNNFLELYQQEMIKFLASCTTIKFQRKNLDLKNQLEESFSIIYESINRKLSKDHFNNNSICVTTILLIDDKIVSVQLGNSNAVLYHDDGKGKKIITELVSKQTLKSNNEYNRILKYYPLTFQSQSDNFSTVYPFKSSCVSEDSLITRCFGEFRSSRFGIIVTPEVTVIKNSNKIKYLVLTNNNLDEILSSLVIGLLIFNKSTHINIAEDILKEAQRFDSSNETTTNNLSKKSQYTENLNQIKKIKKTLKLNITDKQNKENTERQSHKNSKSYKEKFCYVLKLN